MFIIPENYKNATVWEKLEYILQLFCSLIYVIGLLVIQIIRQLSEWIAINSSKIELFELSNTKHSSRVKKQQTVKQIEDLKQEEQKLKERIKHLNIQLGWTLDYIQLTKQGKDTSHLDKFREQLERAFYDPDTDEPDDPDTDEPDDPDTDEPDEPENDQPNHSNDPDDQTPE